MPPPTLSDLEEWRKSHPWPNDRQVEQDLYLSRMLVAIYGDDHLAENLHFKGGTALHKLHFPMPFRYSEDIDINRASGGRTGPLLTRLRKVLEPWMGRARYGQNRRGMFRFDFRVPSCVSDAPLRIKLELHLRDIQRFDESQTVAYAVENPWFSGSANVRVFSLEETLATKMQALMGRHKGRDLFDLDWALLFCPQLDIARTVELFGLHCKEAGNPISRAEAEQRMFAKIAQPNRFDEIINYVPAEQRRHLIAQGTKDAFARVFAGLIERLPGNPWARSPEMIRRLDLQPTFAKARAPVSPEEPEHPGQNYPH